jgi:Fe-S cluster assembly ATP-binding protein
MEREARVFHPLFAHASPRTHAHTQNPLPLPSTVLYKGDDLLALEPEDRARAGVFLSFQMPTEVPGVANADFLRLACNARRKARGQPELDPIEFYGFLTPKLTALNMDPSFLNRDVNAGFSGGEKKRNEILQLAVMEADLAILDEIDSGLDIDALRDVAAAVVGLRRPDAATLMVTHYKVRERESGMESGDFEGWWVFFFSLPKRTHSTNLSLSPKTTKTKKTKQRLLNLVAPDRVHVMEAGRIIHSGGPEVADVLEGEGYEGIRKLLAAAA